MIHEVLFYYFQQIVELVVLWPINIVSDNVLVDGIHVLYHINYSKRPLAMWSLKTLPYCR
jgi:hypothetical protein